MDANRTVRPVDIARELGISTSSLRHYERWGIVPPVERAPSGYRTYERQHLAYFRCIRAMEPGYCMKVTGDVMRKLMSGEVDDALWLVAQARATLCREREIAKQALGMLEGVETLGTVDGLRRGIRTIGDVTRMTGIPETSIRYWERVGLLQASRHASSGYRLFDNRVLRQILLIRTLRTCGYSLSAIQTVLGELDHNGIEQAMKVALESLQRLDRQIRDQLRGDHALYELCRLIGAM